MTGDEFRKARLAMGLSVREFAMRLRLAPSSARNIRRYERETGPPPQLAARTRELLQAAGAKTPGEQDG